MGTLLKRHTGVRDSSLDTIKTQNAWTSTISFPEAAIVQFGQHREIETSINYSGYLLYACSEPKSNSNQDFLVPVFDLVQSDPL